MTDSEGNFTISEGNFTVSEGKFSVSDYIRNFEMIPGKTYFTQTIFVSLSIIIFLSSLYVVSKLMENRKAFKLKWVAFFHNMIMVVISTITTWGICSEVIRIKLDGDYKDKFFSSLACVPRGSRLIGPLYFWTFVYHCTKWYELVDTYLIILRKNKKGLSFLHVLHHSGMLYMVLEWFYAGFGFLWCVAGVNSFVHIVMYFYYGLTSIGIRFRYRNLITLLQLVQFAIGAVYFAYWFPGRLFFNTNCSGNPFVMAGSCFYDLLFFYLFFDFYRVSFKGRKKSKSTTTRPSAEEGITNVVDSTSTVVSTTVSAVSGSAQAVKGDIVGPKLTLPPSISTSASSSVSASASSSPSALASSAASASSSSASAPASSFSAASPSSSSTPASSSSFVSAPELAAPSVVGDADDVDEATLLAELNSSPSSSGWE